MLGPLDVGTSAGGDESAQKAHGIGEVWHAMFGNALFFIKVSLTAFGFFLGVIFIARWFGAC